MKASGLQYLAHEHQAGAVPDQQLDPVRPLRAEDEDHPREGFESEFMLDQRRQADGTFTEVDRLCRHHHLERPWRDDHSDRLTAASPRAICSSLPPGGNWIGSAPVRNPTHSPPTHRHPVPPPSTHPPATNTNLIQ